MAVEHVVDAEIVVDGNGNRVSSYSGSNTSCFQFDTERVLELFNHKTIAYLKNPAGFSNAVYISGIKASMYDGKIIIDAIEFEYYGRPENKSLDIDSPFYPIDFISKLYKWTLYVEKGTFDTDKDEGWFVPYKVLEDPELGDIKKDAFYMYKDEDGAMFPIHIESVNGQYTITYKPYHLIDGKFVPVQSSRHCGAGYMMRNKVLFRELTHEEMEKIEMSESNYSVRIRPKDPETIKGIRPSKHYEFDPEYFYKLCAFTVIDLRSDPITRYECILIETNPTYLVFAAFDAEKEYSSKGAFNNIKRLTVNMDRYMAGEFQLIRHVWEGAE
jgi:hypothetical protein